MPGNVVVLGSLNTDIIFKLERPLVKGETVIAHEISSYEGGKGANQAVAAARFGAIVRMIGAVGNDSNGAHLINCLKAEGIDCQLVEFSKTSSTGKGFVFQYPDNDYSAVVVAGANYDISNGLIVQGIDSLSCNDILVLQLEIPVNLIYQALKKARSKNVTTLLNFAPSHRDHIGIIELVDILIVNSHEAADLVQKPVKDITSAKEAALELYRQVGDSAIVTLGALGAVVVDFGGFDIIEPYRVSAIDTIGAGDTFVGCIAALVIEGYSVRAAAQIAGIAAALATTRKGAQRSIPKRKEVMEVLNKLNRR